MYIIGIATNVLQDEKTILIEKALGPENIDEVFAKSKEYRERESKYPDTVRASWANFC